MVTIGTQRDLDWLFESMALAGNCESCPARAACRKVDDAEEDAETPIPERVSCGQILRSQIGAVVTKKETLRIPGEQRRT
ncbi:MAG: hypothetical protein UEP57_08085 [Oscillospiraceae bacterium]|nr:hypothetical protein [Oscillospiraceae bacterium]